MLKTGGSVVFLPEGSVLWLFGETTLECDHCQGNITTISSSAMIVEHKDRHHTTARFLTDERNVPRPVVLERETAVNINFGGCSVINDVVFIHWEKVSKTGQILGNESGDKV
jgi:hypothetical protein